MGRGVLHNPAGFARALRACSRIPLSGSAWFTLHLVAFGGLAFLARGLSTSSKETWQNCSEYLPQQAPAVIPTTFFSILCLSFTLDILASRETTRAPFSIKLTHDRHNGFAVATAVVGQNR